MAKLRAGSVADISRSIHKVRLTNEADCDYECVFDMNINAVLPSGLTIWDDLKAECEFYISNNKRLWNKGYFKLKEIDPYSNEFIYLFIKQEGRQFNFYVWKVVGICHESDWSEELEESGRIRSWIESSLDPVDDGDWVIDLRIRQMENQLESLYEEDRDAYERLLTQFVKEQEKNVNTNESNGISIDKRYRREIQRIKKENGLT